MPFFNVKIAKKSAINAMDSVSIWHTPYHASITTQR